MPVNKSLCIGCYTYENNMCMVKVSCTKKGIKKICPCINCLIKMLCDSPCQEYREYEKFLGIEMGVYVTENNEQSFFTMQLNKKD